MRAIILLLSASVALGGCSILKKDMVPVCDGKHRRPANLYGSVLGEPAAPPTAAADKLSALPPASGSCA